jgi:GT2 family glycosyltransferase
MKVNLIAVNYNTSSETIKMIESLAQCAGYINRLIIVDNLSSEDEVIILKKYLESDDEIVKDVECVYLSKNVGYFPGLNCGLDLLSSKDRESNYTIVCNNDLEFNSKFFYNLFSCEYPSEAFAIAPSVKTINDVYQNPSLIAKPSKLRFLFYKLYYSNYYIGRTILKIWRSLGFGIDSAFNKDNVAKSIFIGIGAIYILTPRFFYKAKRLDYPLFLYGEEAFFSRQVYTNGGLIWYEPNIEVIHSESVSTSKLPSKFNYELNAKAFRLYEDYFRE